MEISKYSDQVTDENIFLLIFFSVLLFGICHSNVVYITGNGKYLKIFICDAKIRH